MSSFNFFFQKVKSTKSTIESELTHIVFFLSIFSKKLSQPSQPLKGIHLYNLLCSRFSQKVKSTKSTTEGDTHIKFFILQIFSRSEVNQVNHWKRHNTYCFFQFFCQKVKSTKSTIESNVTHIVFFLQFFSKSEVNQVNHWTRHTYEIFYALDFLKKWSQPSQPLKATHI